VPILQTIGVRQYQPVFLSILWGAAARLGTQVDPDAPHTVVVERLSTGKRCK
jgi:hypothetical protein